MGAVIVPKYGTEPELLNDYAKVSDLGLIALGAPGIAFIDAESGAPLRVIALEEDTAITAAKREAALDELKAIGLDVAEVDVTHEHQLVQSLIRKRING